MRLLLLFLFFYFTYRYGRYIFNSFKNKNAPQQPKQTVHQNNSSSTATTPASRKNNEDDGEYVEFEEVKE